MLKKIVSVMLMVFMVTVCFGSLTHTIVGKPTSEWWTGQNPNLDPAWAWAKEVEDRLEHVDASSAFYYDPTDTVPTASEGMTYYNETLAALRVYTGSGWETLEAGGDYASLDEAYGGGHAIAVDGTAITLTVANASNNTALAINQDEADNDNDALVITMGTGAIGTAVEIDSQTSGTDIAGDNWSVAQTGILSAVSLVLTNGGIINNTTNNEIEFIENSEQFSFAFNGNTLTLATDTGIDTLALGVIDDLSGVGNIAFDAAAGGISLDGTTNAWDLTIAQTGTVDSSLILTSAGSVSDALSLITTDGVGSIKVNSADNIDIDATDDITIDTAGGSITTTLIGGDFALDATDASIHLDAGEAVVDAINIDSAAGGLDVDVALSISLKSTEDTADSIEVVSTAGGIDITAAGAATEDIDIVNTAGSVNITAGEDNAAAIVIQENGGTTGGINIWANQGEAASATGEHDASVQLHSDAGGIGLLSGLNGANAIRIEADGGTDEMVSISSVKGTGTSLGASSIELDSTVGGICIQANAAAKDININSVLGSIYIEAEENAANAILITADGGTTSGVIILNDTGTGDESILLDSDAGGITVNANAGSIDIEAVGAETGDLKLSAGDDMTLTAAGDLTLAVTGTFNMAGAIIANNRITTIVDVDHRTLTAAESGATVIFTMTGAAATATLPAATASEVGVWYILVDGNPTGGRDLSVDPEGIGTINGDAAGHTITCVNDRDGEAVYIFCTAADTWYTVALGSSTVWTEE